VHQFDWVTVPLTPVMLIREVFRDLTHQASSGLVSVAIPGIYMKQPYTVMNHRGKHFIKQRFVPVAAVVATRLKEDAAEDSETARTEDEATATYKGAYLLLSNRFDAPEEALRTYMKRWRGVLCYFLWLTPKPGIYQGLPRTA